MAGSDHRCFKGRFVCIPSGLPLDNLLELSKVSTEKARQGYRTRLHSASQPLVFMGVWVCHLCHLANEG